MESLLAAQDLQIADQCAIRQLLETYARCADRQDVDAQLELFTEDACFVIFVGAQARKPSYVLHGKEAIRETFEDLHTHDPTNHILGESNSTILGDIAISESCCLTHRLTGDDKMTLVSIRYKDVCLKRRGEWLFVKRSVFVDWIETRTSKGKRGVEARAWP